MERKDNERIPLADTDWIIVMRRTRGRRGQDSKISREERRMKDTALLDSWRCNDRHVGSRSLAHKNIRDRSTLSRVHNLPRVDGRAFD